MKILVFDLEILANPDKLMQKYFGAYPAFAMGADISEVICFGYMWAGDEKANCINVWNKDIGSEEKLLREAYKIMNEAQCIVTFYGTKFDRRFIQARFAKYGLFIDPKLLHVDMYRVVKKNFKFSRNRLDDCLNFFDLPRKIQTGGQELWYKVYKKDKEAQEEMSIYCANDVLTLNQLFIKLRPYVEHRFFYNHKACPTCGDAFALVKNGNRVTKSGLKQVFKCNNCGSICREAINNLQIYAK